MNTALKVPWLTISEELYWHILYVVYSFSAGKAQLVFMRA